MSSSAPARREGGSHATPATQDDGHGDHDGHGHEPVVVNGVSSDQEPSVEWGWHGHYPNIARFAGFLAAGICLVLIDGNHVGKQEDIWLVILAVGFLALSVGNIVRARTSWRR